MLCYGMLCNSGGAATICPSRARNVMLWHVMGYAWVARGRWSKSYVMLCNSGGAATICPSRARNVMLWHVMGYAWVARGRWSKSYVMLCYATPGAPRGAGDP
jgi:hypothetical protein